MPAEARALVERLAGRPWPGAASLGGEVEGHLRELTNATRRNELLDVATARRLARNLLILLVDADQLAPEMRGVVLVAARYFILDDDASPDSGDVLGLDDDVAVFNAATRLLGRPDLVIELA